MDRNKLRQRPVFIAGHPKAGTSLLLNLLDSHSQLLVFPEETLFFREVLPILKETPQKRWFELAERSLIDFFNWDPENPVESQAGFESHDYSLISFEQVRT